MHSGTKGTFTANHKMARKHRAQYPAEIVEGPDTEGNYTMRIVLPEGHPDKPRGGAMLIHAPLTAFSPD